MLNEVGSQNSWMLGCRDPAHRRWGMHRSMCRVSAYLAFRSPSQNVYSAVVADQERWDSFDDGNLPSTTPISNKKDTEPIQGKSCTSDTT